MNDIHLLLLRPITKRLISGGVNTNGDSDSVDKDDDEDGDDDDGCCFVMLPVNMYKFLIIAQYVYTQYRSTIVA